MTTIRLGAIVLMAQASILLAFGTDSASGGIVLLTESFESPVVSGYANNTAPDNGNWIPSNSSSGFGWDRRGMYNEDTGDFSTPFGDQAYGFWYNSQAGLTTSEGVIGPIVSNGSYLLKFNLAAVLDADPSANYRVELVAFDDVDDSARGDVSGALPTGGTILAFASGSVSSNDMSATDSIAWNATAPVVGQDLAIRVLGSNNFNDFVLYDNLQLQLVPEPSTILLAICGILGLAGLMRYRRRQQSAS